MTENKKVIYYTIKLVITGGCSYKIVYFLYKKYGRKLSRRAVKSIMIKTGLLTLGVNFGMFGFVGRYCTPRSCRRLKNVGRCIVNFTLLPYRIPCRMADLSLEAFELFFLGETFPLSEGGFLLLEFS